LSGESQDEAGGIERGGWEAGTSVVGKREQGDGGPGAVTEVVVEAAGVVVGGDGEGEAAVVGDPAAETVAEGDLG